MNDGSIFFIGILVSLIVISAVGLLIWGAANEPRTGLNPSEEAGPQSANSDIPPGAAASRQEAKALGAE